MTETLLPGLKNFFAAVDRVSRIALAVTLVLVKRKRALKPVSMRAIWLQSGATWFVLLLLSARAHAQNADADAQARALFEQGTKAYTEGRFVDAAELFQHSYVLSSKPALLWNCASAWEQQYGVDHESESLRTARKLYASYATTAGLSALEREAIKQRVRRIDAELASAPSQEPTPTPALALMETQSPPPTARTRRLWLWVGVPVGAAAVAVAAVALGVVLSRPGNASDPHAPDGTVTVRF
jgi:hypothetical protein